MVISSEKTCIRIDHLAYFNSLNKRQIELLQEEEEAKELSFEIPSHIVSNNDKTTYRIGFTAKFLKLLYPEMKFDDICDVLSERYEVFLSRRQIERYVKKFKENKKFH